MVEAEAPAMSSYHYDVAFPSTFIGNQMRVAVFTCECGKQFMTWHDVEPITTADAQVEARKNGWSKTKDGWKCPLHGRKKVTS
jgi:hypothetical protein